MHSILFAHEERERRREAERKEEEERERRLEAERKETEERDRELARKCYSCGGSGRISGWPYPDEPCLECCNIFYGPLGQRYSGSECSACRGSGLADNDNPTN